MELLRINLGKDMAVGHEDVEPAVIIEVKKAHPPTQELRVSPKPRLQHGIVERSIPVVVVHIRGLVGVIGLNNVEPTIAIVVPHSHSHPALGGAVLVDGTADLASDFFEGSIALVVIEAAGNGIASHIDVRPAVVVEISCTDPKTIGTNRKPILVDKGYGRIRAARGGNARCDRYIFKGAVAAVTIQNVGAAIHALRTAADSESVILAVSGATRLRAGLDIKVDVIGYKQVEMPISVVVDKTASRIPARMA